MAEDIGGLLGVDVDAATFLAGRATMLNLSRPGRISAGGATRLLPTADGWCAVALPRADDLAALPALMEVDAVTGDPWGELSRWAATRSGDDVIARAQLLDIAAAALGEAPAGLPTVRVVRWRRGASTGRRAARGRYVVAVGRAAVRPASRPRGRQSSSRWRARTGQMAPAAESRLSSTG